MDATSKDTVHEKSRNAWSSFVVREFQRFEELGVKVDRMEVELRAFDGNDGWGDIDVRERPRAAKCRSGCVMF